MKFFDKKEHLTLACYFLLIICAAFALSYPLAFRTATGNQLFIGGNSYETLLIAQNSQTLLHPLQSNPWFVSTHNSPVPFSFSNYLYVGFLELVPLWALPALLSFLLLSLLWVTLNAFDIPLSARFIAACMFAFSPLFVATQLSLGPAVFLLLFFSLLVFALRSHWYPFVCAIISIACGLFGVDALLMITIALLFTNQKTGHAPILKQKQYALVGAVFGFLIWLVLSIATKNSFYSLLGQHSINSIFVDFGAQYGQTILLVILALIGAVNVWKKELRWYFVAALLLFIWSAFFPQTALITTAVLSYFAGSAFTKIWNSKWTYASLKIIVLTSILFSVLISYFVFSNQLITASPTIEATTTYTFISENTPLDSVIFTSPGEGAMVAYFAHRSVVSTSNPSQASFEKNQLQMQKIMYSKTLAQVLGELKALNATHILVDPQLRSGDQWREDKGGLALLLRNRRAFSLVFDYDYLLYQINYDVK